MFSGIVEEVGGITSLEKTLTGTRMTILASTVLSDLNLGDSVSVSGICLTVVSRNEQGFSVDVSPETLSIRTLSLVTPGAPVNLERAMKLSERIGGHLVAGHVDGVGTIRGRHQENNAIVFTIEAPPEVLRYCVMKGSITVDGISLTVAALEDDAFEVALVPHTLEVTTLGTLAIGDRVNLEVDVLAKYVERLIAT